MLVFIVDFSSVIHTVDITFECVVYKYHVPVYVKYLWHYDNF